MYAGKRVLRNRLSSSETRDGSSDDGGDQARSLGVANCDRSLRHHRMLTQHLFDLAELDPVAPDLHLIVEPADELDRPVGSPAGRIAGAIHGCTRAGLRNKTFRGQLRRGVVPRRDLGTTDAQLAHRTTWNRTPASVEDVDSRVGDRTSDRHVSHGAARGTLLLGDADRGLGGPIDVRERHSRQPVHHQVHQVLAEGLATGLHLDQ